jgi:hypothetical protein
MCHHGAALIARTAASSFARLGLSGDQTSW